MKHPMALACLCALPSALGAQQPGTTLGGEAAILLFGSVVSRGTGDPVSAASITLRIPGSEGEPAWSGESDAAGEFRARALPLGEYEISVEALSLMSVTQRVTLSEAGAADIRIEMTGPDFELPPIVVVARRQTKLAQAGFYERRGSGTGYFMDLLDIAALAPLRVSDLFRSIPGARVSPDRLGRASVRLRGSCTPVIVSDGLVVSGGIEIDELFAVGTIEGIEVYHGSSIPSRYAANTTCGAVVFWSRDPQVTTEGGSAGWKGVVAVGLAILAVVITR